MTVLFQYKTINKYFWRQLKNSEIFCKNPSKFNDPFDCSIDWKRAILSVLEHDNIADDKRQYLESIYKKLDMFDPNQNAGISCFTNNCETQLMWTHYADNHKGVCLGYGFQMDDLYDTYPTSGDFFFMGAGPVIYDDNHFSSWLVADNLSMINSLTPAENAAIKLYTAKSSCWKYEEEYRIVMNKEGSIKIKRHYLKQLTFGLRVSENDRREITRVVKEKYKDVIFSEVIKSPKYDTAIEIVDC